MAAVSNAAKTIAEHGGGFVAKSQDPLIDAQVQLLDVRDDMIDVVVKLVLRLFGLTCQLVDAKGQIIANANMHCQSMFKVTHIYWLL